jgi:hypothetical protein
VPHFYERLWEPQPVPVSKSHFCQIHSACPQKFVEESCVVPEWGALNDDRLEKFDGQWKSPVKKYSVESAPPASTVHQILDVSHWELPALEEPSQNGAISKFHSHEDGSCRVIVVDRRVTPVLLGNVVSTRSQSVEHLQLISFLLRIVTPQQQPRQGLCPPLFY